ncbi:MAG: glycoside hydrolase family 32 protein [Phycisphaerales bacterium]|nr:glycoside hydrolase family 32 protein [Phycisphaerales bacterium]
MAKTLHKVQRAAADSSGMALSRRKVIGAFGLAAAGLSAGGIGWGAARAKETASSIVAADVGYNQSLRPQFHFTARTGWLNDPNGLVFVDGCYHMFFQHNPFGTEWGHMTWGHAISRDLVHWRQLAEAIRPDRMGTIWSGSAAVDTLNTTGFRRGSQPAIVAMYTAAGGTSKISKGQPFTQCIAYSNDGGRTFTKYAHNPVIPQIVNANRDPKIIWYPPERCWVAPLFLSPDRGFAIFKSSDLKHWTKLQELPFPQSQECPNFFPMPVQGSPGEHRWIFTGANSQYLIGHFDGKRFTPELGPFAMETGRNFYAAQVYSNIPASDGRTIQIGWMRGGKYPGMPFNQQMSFPCALTLRQTLDGLRIFREPVREISHLWRKTHHAGNLALSSQKIPLPATGGLFDIQLIINAHPTGALSLTVNGQEIVVDIARRQVRCLGASGRLELGKPLAGERTISLRILADRTSLEIFSPNGPISMSSCYVPGGHALPVACVIAGGRAVVRSLTIHELSSAWPGTNRRS